MKTRINHVAITLPPEEFTPERQAELAEFFAEVFGWYEFRTTEPNEPLLFAFGEGGEFGQFLYLQAGEPALNAPPMDHLGIQVGSMAELDDILARANARAERDPRVTVIGKQTEPQASRYGTIMLTNCYVGFLLPLMIEVQYLEGGPG